MKCISLHQPWATLVVIGAKRIETRHWKTRHTGPLLIHAAKKWDKWTKAMCFDEPFYTVLNAAGFVNHSDFRKSDFDLPFGAIIGAVNLVKCFPTEYVGEPAITYLERKFGDYSAGRFGWLMESPLRFAEP